MERLVIGNGEQFLEVNASIDEIVEVILEPNNETKRMSIGDYPLFFEKRNVYGIDVMALAGEDAESLLLEGHTYPEVVEFVDEYVSQFSGRVVPSILAHYENADMSDLLETVKTIHVGPMGIVDVVESKVVSDLIKQRQ